jgi:hypothetical protein
VKPRLISKIPAISGGLLSENSIGTIRPDSRTHVLGLDIVKTVGGFVQAVARALIPVMNDADLPRISCFHWAGKMESNLEVKY